MKGRTKTVAQGKPLDDDEAELALLALISREDIEDAQATGRRRSDVLGAALLLAAIGSRYRWETDAAGLGRFIDTRTDRVVPPAVVRQELDAYLEESEIEARRLAEQLQARQISLADWQIAMRREIKRTGLVSAAFMVGGWGMMTAAVFGRVGDFVAGQYTFLQGFAQQIADKVQRMDGSLRNRAALYSQAGRNFYHQLKHEALGPEYQLVRSIRHATDSCDDCIRLDGVWFELGDPDYLLPGDRQCRHNCKCSEQFGTIRAGEEVTLETA